MKSRAGRDNPERIAAKRPIGKVVLPPTNARRRQNEMARFRRRKTERRVRAEPDEAEIVRDKIEIDVRAAVRAPKIRRRRRNIGGEPRLRRRGSGEAGIERTLARIVDGVNRRGLERRRKRRIVRSVDGRVFVGGERGRRDERRAQEKERETTTVFNGKKSIRRQALGSFCRARRRRNELATR